MRARLITRGNELNIFALELDNGSCEVINFLNMNESEHREIISGFTKIIDHIAENGTNRVGKFYKCWNYIDTLICELKKGRYRINCFRYDNNILLISFFLKTQDVETREYMKAIKLKKEFEENPIWEE